MVARVEGLPFSIDWLPDGRLVATTHAGVVVGPDLAPYGAAGQPFNEIVVDASGNCWVDMPGSMPWEERKPGIVAVVRPDGSSEQVADDVWFPNGMAIIDDSTLVVAESHADRLTAWTLGADGTLTDRRVWAQLGEDEAPDGICVDASGAIWYASVPAAALRPGGRGRRGARDGVRGPGLLLLHARRRRRPDAVRRREQLRSRGRLGRDRAHPPRRRTAAPVAPDLRCRFARLVRLVVARCQVDYAGRLTAHLPMATRVLMIKADGSVLVHSDGGSYKPLNWMSPPCTVREGANDDGVVEWTVTGKDGDTLRILLEEIHHDSSHELGIDPGLQKDGVEKHLQELLAEHPATSADGLTLVRREYPTPIGPVDLMCRDATGASVAVEIKRRGEIDGVEQLTRYLELLNREPLLTTKGPVRGIFAAQLIKPQARVLAEDRGITCAVVDYDGLRGMDDPEHRLF